jgi:two-component system CheB/CheR fusion protein
MMNVRDRIPESLRTDALARLIELGQAKTLEPYRTQRLARDGTVKEVSIISTALLDVTGRTYAIVTTERLIGPKVSDLSDQPATGGED